MSTDNIKIDLVSAKFLKDFQNDLQNYQKKLCNELENLQKAYDTARWNDMVSEKARMRLNDYVRRFASDMSTLSGVIAMLEELYQLAEKYESMRY